jgi:hypothetical protein
MQETVGSGVDFPVALDAIGVEAHMVGCLYKDLCEEGYGEEYALNKGL